MGGDIRYGPQKLEMSSSSSPTAKKSTQFTRAPTVANIKQDSVFLSSAELLPSQQISREEIEVT